MVFQAQPFDLIGGVSQVEGIQRARVAESRDIERFGILKERTQAELASAQAEFQARQKRETVGNIFKLLPFTTKVGRPDLLGKLGTELGIEFDIPRIQEDPKAFDEARKKMDAFATQNPDDTQGQQDLAQQFIEEWRLDEGPEKEIAALQARSTALGKIITQESKIAGIAETGRQARLTAAEKAPPTRKLLGPDNLEHEFQYNPTTKQYDIDLGRTALKTTRVKPATQTIVKLGPDGKEHRYQFNPTTLTYDRDLGRTKEDKTPTGIGATTNLNKQYRLWLNDARSNAYRQIFANKPDSLALIMKAINDPDNAGEYQGQLNQSMTTEQREEFEDLVDNYMQKQTPNIILKKYKDIRKRGIPTRTVTFEGGVLKTVE